MKAKASPPKKVDGNGQGTDEGLLDQDSQPKDSQCWYGEPRLEKLKGILKEYMRVPFSWSNTPSKTFS